MQAKPLFKNMNGGKKMDYTKVGKQILERMGGKIMLLAQYTV